MDKTEESRKRKKRPSPDSDEKQEFASRQNPATRQNVPPSSPQFSMSSLSLHPQPGQNEEMPDAPSASGVAEESSHQGDGKRTLLLGEQTMKFATALTKKHPGTAAGMHATSYESEDELFKEGSEGLKRKKELQAKGAKVSHNVDATKLAETFGEEKFTSTRFHYPRSGARNGSQAPLINNYAESANSILEEGGKLHISLPSSRSYGKRQGKKEKATRNKLYGSTPIKNIEEKGYKFQEKRKDPQERYGDYGYSHEVTGTETSRDGLHGHEYVFKKSKEPSSPNQEEYSEVETDSGTESSGSKEKSE